MLFRSVETPIDLEHKQYLLYAYLQKVDFSFYNKILSPHLLHLERLIDELNGFTSSFEIIRKEFDRNRYVYFDNIKLEGEDNNLVVEVKEIVEFAKTQIEPRIKSGYLILKKNNQILY